MTAGEGVAARGWSIDSSLVGTVSRTLAETGYCVVGGVLGPQELDALRDRIDSCAAAEVAAGMAWLEPPDNQRLWMLLNKGPDFAGLVLRGAGLVTRTGMLGDRILLSNVTANIVRPGGRPQAAHADQDFLPQPWQRAEVITLIWVLDDFTEANGATRVLPGSHTSHARHDDADLSGAPAVSAAAGALLLMDGRLWHAAGANMTADQTRRAVIVNYCRPYLRQQENFWRSAGPGLLRTAPGELLELLGANIYDSLGMAHGLTPDWRRRAREEFGPSWR